MRKAQGISVSTIIMIVLGLLALVVIGAIFMNRVGRGVVTLESCQDIGGICKDRGSLANPCDDGSVGYSRYTDDAKCLINDPDGSGSKVVDPAQACCLAG